QHGLGRAGVHHRHRRALHARRVPQDRRHLPRLQRLQRHRRRQRLGLQRARHARGRHRGRQDVRHRQGRDDPRRQGVHLLRRQRQQHHHRRHRLGDRQPHQAGRRQPVAGRRRQPGDGRRGEPPVERGRVRGRGRGQLQRGCLHLVAGPRQHGDHGGLVHQRRRQVVVQQLGKLRGAVRAGQQHHLGLVHGRHGDQHHQRHLDGLAARGGRGRALQGHLRRRRVLHHPHLADQQRHGQRDHRQRDGHAQPPAVQGGPV
ncbi:MAG: Alkaline serine exoprotease A precursor, partial [uncultured Gemmatimonadetes bacterium]